MHIYGITGPSGAGKSKLSEWFAAKGIPHVDADALYHELLIPPSPVTTAIFNAFGREVMTADGGVDRRALSTIVFQDPDKLALLNRTVLDAVLAELRIRLARLEQDGVSAVAVDAPTLIESGFDRECDTVVVVLCAKEERIARIVRRDGISRERAEERVNAQQPDEFYANAAHVVLRNDGDTLTLWEMAERTIPLHLASNP